MRKAEFYRHARHDLDGPLHGVRVLDVSTVWSGPMAGCLLADLGCEVIRVELPGSRAATLAPEIPGTRLSLFHQTVNRNKRSIGLDLRAADGRDVFLRLVATADIVIENFRPGTLERWGAGYPQCRAVRPDLVFVSISGWGQFGPDMHRPGYDPITQAASGWMAANGEPDGGPAKAPTYLADDLAGLHAALGALAALRHRDGTGEGQHVDVSMLDCLLFQSNGLLTLGAAAGPPPRWGNEVDIVAPASVFSCADGEVYLAVALDRQWRRLAEVMGRPELSRAAGFATNDERRANRCAVNEIVGEWCGKQTVATVTAALGERDITVSPVRTYAEAARDPHVWHRDMLQDTALSNGTTGPLTGPAVKFSRTPTRIRMSAPEPGADTQAILAEFAIPAENGPAARPPDSF